MPRKKKAPVVKPAAPVHQDVMHFWLKTGQQIAGRGIEDDEYFYIEMPMLIRQDSIDGVGTINLVRYLPFTPAHQQVLTIKKSDVLSINQTTTAFNKYYYLSVQYQLTFVQPQTEDNMAQINANLEAALSTQIQDFMSLLNKHHKQLPTEISTKVH